MTPQIITKVLEYSNECGAIVYNNFKKITVDEFDNFIGFSLMMGLKNDHKSSF